METTFKQKPKSNLFSIKSIAVFATCFLVSQQLFRGASLEAVAKVNQNKKKTPVVIKHKNTTDMPKQNAVQVLQKQPVADPEIIKQFKIEQQFSVNGGNSEVNNDIHLETGSEPLLLKLNERGNASDMSINLSFSRTKQTKTSYLGFSFNRNLFFITNASPLFSADNVTVAGHAEQVVSKLYYGMEKKLNRIGINGEVITEYRNYSSSRREYYPFPFDQELISLGDSSGLGAGFSLGAISVYPLFTNEFNNTLFGLLAMRFSFVGGGITTHVSNFSSDQKFGYNLLSLENNFGFMYKHIIISGLYYFYKGKRTTVYSISGRPFENSTTNEVGFAVSASGLKVFDIEIVPTFEYRKINALADDTFSDGTINSEENTDKVKLGFILSY